MSGLFLSLFIHSANNSFSLPEMWCLVKRWKYKSKLFFPYCRYVKERVGKPRSYAAGAPYARGPFVYKILWFES